MAKPPGFDPYEYGARNSNPELAALQPLPPLLDRLQPRKWLGWFVLGIVVLAVLRGGVGGGGPSVDGSCTDPGFALDRTEVDQYAALRWSAAGPTGSSVVLGLDTTALPTSAEAGRVTGPVALQDCRAGGVLGVRAEPGDHTLVAYLVAQDGSVRELSSTKVVVTRP